MKNLIRLMGSVCVSFLMACQFPGTDSGNPQHLSDTGAIVQRPIENLAQNGFCALAERCGLSFRSQDCQSRVMMSEAFGAIYPLYPQLRNGRDLENLISQGWVKMVASSYSTCMQEVKNWRCGDLPQESENDTLENEIARFIEVTIGTSQMCRTAFYR